jgi:hypothetical protein
MRLTSIDHRGGDPKLRRAIFAPKEPDPLGRRADSDAGAKSILVGVAARTSADFGGKPVLLSDLR